MLKTQIEPVLSYEDMAIAQKIIETISKTHGPTHKKYKLEVREIFSCKRANEN